MPNHHGTLTRAIKDRDMRRVSSGLTIIALTAAVGCALLPRGETAMVDEAAAHRPDFSAAGVDPTPVGTAKQMARIKRVRATRKA